MANDIKISEFPTVVGALSGNEFFPILQGGVNKKASLNQISINTWGFGTMASQDADNVNITGGTIVSSVVTGDVLSATNVANGLVNQIVYQSDVGQTAFISAPVNPNTFLEWSGSAFQWSTNPLGTVTSVAALTIGTTGSDLSSTVANPTTTPVITLNVPNASAANRGALTAADWSTFNGKQAALVSGTNIKTVGGATLLGAGDVGTIGVAYGGTGATTAVAARTNLGATTLGANLFTITNPSAVTFPRFNADNTVSALDAATFRTAIGAGTSSTTGTVTSVAALTIGTAGTDLSSTVANSTTTPVITLNVPTASAANRGALSSTDWSTFNGKQAALVSGTNIKTVNGTSLLGAGDVGTMGVAFGGTGATSLTSGYLLKGNGTTAVSASVIYDNGTNVGIGVTPSAWGSGYTALQLTTYSSLYDYNAGYSGLSSNAYFNGTNWIYRTSNFSTRYEQYVGSTNAHSWYISPSGTAGAAISFVQAMTLNASGNLLVGTTSGSSKLTVAGTIETTSGGVKFPDATTQTTAAPSVVNIQEFTTPGTSTWTKPAGAKLIEIQIWSGGAGGGSGFSGTGASTPGGGGGGTSGKYATTKIIASDAGATESVVVGAGGAGAAAGVTTAGAGGASSFGSFVSLSGVIGSGSGTATTAGQFLNEITSATTTILNSYYISRSNGTSGGLGATAPSSPLNSGSAGGGGGGAGSAGAAIAGASGALGSTYGASPTYPAAIAGIINNTTTGGPAGGTAPGGAGANGAARFLGGDGGGGGASVVTGTGGKGGNGGYPGGGGGGGGAAWNGTGGAGGDGAAGRVRVITYF